MHTTHRVSGAAMNKKSHVWKIIEKAYKRRTVRAYNKLWLILNSAHREVVSCRFALILSSIVVLVGGAVSGRKLSYKIG